MTTIASLDRVGGRRQPRVVKPRQGLALIVGSGNIIKPEASAAKIVPAFAYLAAWYALAGLIYSVFGIETKGRSIEQIDSEFANRRTRKLESAKIPQ